MRRPPDFSVPESFRARYSYVVENSVKILGNTMTRKLLFRGVAFAAILVAVVALGSQVVSADQFTTAPSETGSTVAAAPAKVAEGADLAVDMNNWQETRVTLGPGTKFKLKRPR